MSTTEAVADWVEPRAVYRAVSRRDKVQQSEERMMAIPVLCIATYEGLPESGIITSDTEWEPATLGGAIPASHRRLEQAGLITRTPDPEFDNDPRCDLVALTEKAARVIIAALLAEPSGDRRMPASERPPGRASSWPECPTPGRCQRLLWRPGNPSRGA